jgi:hypothetical protein
MLVLRKEQVDQLRQAAKRRCADAILVFLAGFSSSLFKTLEEEQQRAVIRFGMDRAEAHGFTSRDPVRLYLELTLLFGSQFDTDPQYPWAGQILAEPDQDASMERVERLYQRAIDYREKVNGPENVHALEALQHFRYFLQQPLRVSLETFIPDMVSEFGRLYPQKAAELDREGLEAVLRKGLEAAEQLGILTARGAVLLSLLMLTLGHGCTADPLYPWISGALERTAETDSEARIEGLEKEFMLWLDQVLN